MMEISFGSVCSGIEAASVAWTPIGWEPAWFSEIEPFPSALLDHHYPETPNLGDMTALPGRILNGEVEAPDVFCGGTPCQAFSVAGKRQSLDDERGNLSLTFCEIANAIDLVRSRDEKQPTIIFWENVPGVLNTKDNAFGCFLGELAGESCALEPSGGRWTNAGFVLGPKRAIAWRVLDAQYFGLAQRRRRVFVVASARDGFDPAKVLFEFDGVRRDIAPSRETRQEVTGNVGTGFTPSSFGQYREGTGTIRASGGDLGGGIEVLVAAKWPADIASTLNASFGSKLGLENQHIDGGAPLFVPAKAFAQNSRDEVRYVGGDGQIAGALAANPGMKQATYVATNNCLNPDQPQCWRVYDPGGVAPALQSGEARGNIIAFNSRQDPVSGPVFGALDTSSPQAQAVAYPLNSMTMLGRPSDGLKPRMGSGIGKPTDPQNTLSAAHHHAVATATAVRRLTPVECERLMGFPDSYTQIPWRGKASDGCPDGHRYKALGNSWAVPNVRWIGERINEEIEKEVKA